MITRFTQLLLLFLGVQLLLGLELHSQIPLIHYDSIVVINSATEDTLINAWAGGLNCPQFSEIDLDGDGNKDLVAFERNFYGAVKTYLNLGSPDNIRYEHAPQYQRYFPQMRNWMLLRDYNCDGKEDIFTSVPAGVAVYRNDSDPGGALQFTLVTSLLQTIGLDGQTPLYVSPPDVPGIADVDGDGDLDILSFNILGSTVEYHKNLSMELYGNCETLEYELKNACWGYFSEDGNNNTVTLFDTCEMNVPDPEKSTLHAGSTILAMDLTGNGATDVVLGDLTFNNLVMVENGGTPTASSMIAIDTMFPSNSVPVDITIFPAAFNVDMNNDGLKDLLVSPNNPNTSENANHIQFYKNTGNAEIPVFEYQQTGFLQEGMIDAGERSFPVFFDENSDGLMDIMVGNFGYFVSNGNYSSQLMLFRNIGTAAEPIFERVTDDYEGFSAFGLHGIYPSFGDMDNDGDQDMITGDEDGLLYYFRNDGGPGNPADFTLSEANYKGIDVGQSAKPQIIDVNRDGLPDLLVGERSGTVNYYQNTGTPENADFSSNPTNDLFGDIDVMPECCTGFSVPFMAEDSTGNHLLYVGSEQGKIYLFNNIENNLDGTFNLVDSLYLSAFNATINGKDINNDGRLEMLFGEYAGGMGLLKYGQPPGVGFNEYKRQNLKIALYPNPAREYVNIYLEGLAPSQTMDDFVIELYALSGIRLKSLKMDRSSNPASIFLKDLPEGLYIVRIYNDQVTRHGKLLIRK